MLSKSILGGVGLDMEECNCLIPSHKELLEPYPDDGLQIFVQAVPVSLGTGEVTRWEFRHQAR